MNIRGTFNRPGCGQIFTHVFCTLGLPVQVRDHALGLKDEMPKSDVNKEYYTQNAEREVGLQLL